VIALRAPAKLTWSLRVVGVRGDGYHLIDAEMATLDLADALTITEAPTTTVTVGGPFADGVPTDRSNLVVRALEAVGRTAHVHVDKRIPHGGGLGGGSADAAAVLRWAGVLDPEVAVRLGADVPFCVVGGRARVTGVGEVVAPLTPIVRVVTLVVPPLHLDTGEVYAVWDQLSGPIADRNDLEPAALAVEPRLAAWRARIAELSGQTPVLAGSGASWFVEGRRDDALGALGVEGATVMVCQTAG
jgi:4-diphosphocytidyl-2-C-methyl-D-erythritol kinase